MPHDQLAHDMHNDLLTIDLPLTAVDMHSQFPSCDCDQFPCPWPVDMPVIISFYAPGGSGAAGGRAAWRQGLPQEPCSLSQILRQVMLCMQWTYSVGP